MIFGRHDRFLLQTLQYFQPLLVHLLPSSDKVSSTLYHAVQWCEQSTPLLIIFIMWFGVWRCPIKSPVSHSASVSQLVLSLAWFPLFLQVCDELSMNSAFSGGVGLATLLIGMIWWFLGAFRIAGSFLLCLPPPPPRSTRRDSSDTRGDQDHI